MNVETITMDKALARRKLKDYQESMRRRVDEEHEALAQAYEALSEGTPLISLHKAITDSGFDEAGRPRLAAARADRRQVEVSCLWYPPHRIRFNSSPSNRDYDTLLIEAGEAPAKFSRGYALVPMIPAGVRNAMKGQPKDHLTLWEVDRWSERRLGVQPDRDPMLLRHLHGDLYAVVAQWDLTELERLVMLGRIG